MKARVLVPATFGNVGPGFDVLGLAIDGLGDFFTVELVDPGAAIAGRDSTPIDPRFQSRIAAVTGRDAALIPRDVESNCTAIAALSLLRLLGDERAVRVTIERRLPVSGGLGGSAAASVGGALAALFATGRKADDSVVLHAALDGEERVAGRHLDNIAPAFFGGLCVCRAASPPDAVRVPVRGDWWITVVTSTQKLETKAARAVLPDSVSRSEMVKQMAHTSAVIAAFATGDYELLRRALVDPFAEPRRAPLIERFAPVKAAALGAGALGCSISGAGPTLFALSPSQAVAERCRAAMVAAFHPLAAEGHVGAVAAQGAHLA